jgi:hypothetical protein
VPAAAPAAASAAPVTPGGLRRRVPQASLAPGLRTPVDRTATSPAAPPVAPSAATALSRYQASRRAAQDDLGREDRP